MAFGGGGGFGSAQNVPQSPFGQAPASPFGGGGGGGVASSGSGGFGAPSNQQGSVGGLFSQPSSGVVGGFGQQQQQQTGSGQLGGFGQPQQQTGGVSPGTSTFCKLRLSCVLIFNFPFDFVFFVSFFLSLSLSRVTNGFLLAFRRSTIRFVVRSITTNAFFLS